MKRREFLGAGMDAKRADLGRVPIALLKPDEDSRRLNGQVEHIEIASHIGLGVFDDAGIGVERVELG